MKQFLKFTFASMLGFFLSIAFVMFIFFVFTFAIVSSIDTTEKVTVSENTILELKFDYEIPERTTYEPIVTFSAIPSMQKNLGMNDIVDAIESAKYDNKIKGIFINLDNVIVGGLSKINTLRMALESFKESNKFILAHGNSIDEKGYFLSSAADSIYLTPTGSLEFDGFGIEVMFFKKALDKLEIEPQIFQYGKFKSATEPFKLEKFSEENKIQLDKYLFSVYDNYISTLSEARNIDAESLKSYADKLLVKSAEDAMKLGLVTDLLYNDEVESRLEALMDSSLQIKKISAKKYFYSVNNSNSSDNRIAVIYALGEILNNEGDEFTIGTENIINSIRKAKENKKVKAIVMRVNSPGGSPLTSDMIWHEIELAKKVKPFIVSMSNMAASGGYYISCNADVIVSEPTGLIGSIGVYGVLPNTQKFFDNKLGVTFDRVLTGENSNLFSITTPMNKEQKKYFQKQIDDIYFDFVDRVSRGRNMTFEEVDEIAQGRIWSGIDAKNIGLVDTLGGLDLALNIAAEKADIKDYKIVEYPVQKEAFEKIMELLSSEIESKIFTKNLPEEISKVSKFTEFLKYTGIQARLPFEYIIN
ncbi:MAG: signal peptide peptidase SppA [Ignavibacteriales bacterium]|nr:signal peptide peptidase SppA [Ignavibacteriales bacterium]